MNRTWGYETVGEAKGRQSRSEVGVFPYVDNSFVVMVRPNVGQLADRAKLFGTLFRRVLYASLVTFDERHAAGNTLRETITSACLQVARRCSAAGLGFACDILVARVGASEVEVLWKGNFQLGQEACKKVASPQPGALELVPFEVDENARLVVQAGAEGSPLDRFEIQEADGQLPHRAVRLLLSEGLVTDDDDLGLVAVSTTRSSEFIRPLYPEPFDVLLRRLKGLDASTRARPIAESIHPSSGRSAFQEEGETVAREPLHTPETEDDEVRRRTPLEKVLAGMYRLRDAVSGFVSARDFDRELRRLVLAAGLMVTTLSALLLFLVVHSPAARSPREVVIAMPTFPSTAIAVKINAPLAANVLIHAAARVVPAPRITTASPARGARSTLRSSSFNLASRFGANSAEEDMLAFDYDEDNATTEPEEPEGTSLAVWAIAALLLLLGGVVWKRRQDEAAATVLDDMRTRQRVAAYEGAFRDMVRTRLGDVLCGVGADRSFATVIDPSSRRIESFAIAWTGVKEDAGSQSVKRIYCAHLPLEDLHGVRLHTSQEQGISKKLKISAPEVTSVALHVHTGHDDHPYFQINLLDRSYPAGAPEVTAARKLGWKWVALLEGVSASHGHRHIDEELSRLREDLEAGLLTEGEYAHVEKRLRRRVTVALNL